MNVLGTILRTLPVLLLTSFVGVVQDQCPPAQAAPSSTPGRLAPSESKYSFGEVFRGETVRHTFVLTNKGPGDLTINEVRAGCTCSAARMTICGKSLTVEETAKAKQLGTLKAGERAELEVILDTLDPGYGAHDGSVTKCVQVFHNDPSSNPLTLTLEASLVTPYTLEPTVLDLGRVRQGQTKKASCVLSSGKLGEFKILRIRPPNGDVVKISFDRLPGDPGAPITYRIGASLLSSATVGTHLNHVELEIDHTRVKTIWVSLRAEVESAEAPRTPR